MYALIPSTLGFFGGRRRVLVFGEDEGRV